MIHLYNKTDLFRKKPSYVESIIMIIMIIIAVGWFISPQSLIYTLCLQKTWCVHFAHALFADPHPVAW